MNQQKTVKFIIEKGSAFYKKLRWKDKFKDPIILTGFEFRSQFRFNYGENEDNILCTLSTDPEIGGITIEPFSGTIILQIPENTTATLKNYDAGIWSLEYRPTLEHSFKRLIGGRWVVEPEVTE